MKLMLGFLVFMRLLVLDIRFLTLHCRRMPFEQLERPVEVAGTGKSAFGGNAVQLGVGTAEHFHRPIDFELVEQLLRAALAHLVKKPVQLARGKAPLARGILHRGIFGRMVAQPFFGRISRQRSMCGASCRR